MKTFFSSGKVTFSNYKYIKINNNDVNTTFILVFDCIYEWKTVTVFAIKILYYRIQCLF